MYYVIGCLLVIVLVFSLFFYFHKKKICEKLCHMSRKEKCDILGRLIGPFGYCYMPSQDIFSTVIDAPQRMFGYTALFDRYASHFNMAIDCMPVYFDYGERTWLIEFWKGQYGIHTGCEVGFYKADSLVPSIFRKTALFGSVDDVEMLPMSLRFFYKKDEIARVCRTHWWLTAFKMGAYSEPEDLWVEIGITFPCGEMLNAFTKALNEQWDADYDVCGMQVLIRYEECSTCKLVSLQKFFFRFCQWRNRILCRLFLWVTKPFCTGIDRVLCLYYYLPPLFWCIFRDKKRKKCCERSCSKGKKACRKRENKKTCSAGKKGGCHGNRL